MKRKKTYKYSILLLIIFLQIFDLSCGPSFLGTVSSSSKSVKSISNVKYDDYELFIKEAYVYKKDDIIKGKLFYTPDYRINAEVNEDNTFKLTSLIIATLIDIGIIYGISTYQTAPKDQLVGNIGKGIGITNFSLDFLLGVVGIASITSSSINNDSTKSQEIKLNSKENDYIYDNKKLLNDVKKSSVKEKLSDVNLILSTKCGEDNLTYKVKVESDGSFSAPYLFFNSLKICTVQFDKDKTYIRIKKDVDFKSTSNHIFSDPIIFIENK